MTRKVGILGSGLVGQTLAAGFRDLGDEAQIGTRSGNAIEGWDGQTGTFSEVTAWADIVVLAVKGSAAEAVVEAAKAGLAHKTVIDTTNPIADAPPQDGVLQFFTSYNESLMERLQAVAPEARFVKAFSSAGNATMIHPKYEAGPPTMFICGNDAAAKQTVAQILQDFGWEAADMGSAVAARAIEPLCILWCIPGMLRNEWSHAFKLLN